MSKPAVLIATMKVRPGHGEAFQAWLVKQAELLARFPGYVSSDTFPPAGAGDGEWTLLLHFTTPELLTKWQQSPERGALVAELVPIIEGGNLGEAMREDAEQPSTSVTQVILSRIKVGAEPAYREWTVRMQKAQASYPGYRGMYVQPPAEGQGGHWTTLLRYDTREHLEAWLAAPERAVLLREAQAFIESEELVRLAAAFPGWVPANSSDGSTPPGWKAALLVLLGLYPIVMVEARYLSPLMASWGIQNALATFLGTFLSVSLTGFVTVPLCMRWFNWWLFPQKDSPSWRANVGLALLVVLFAAEILAFWWAP